MVGGFVGWFEKSQLWLSGFAGMLLILLAAAVHAETEAPKVRIYPTSVMLGEKITLSMQGPTVFRDFERLDMDALREHFAIYEVDTESDLIRLRLYPLGVGQFQIKAQRLGVIRIPDTTIEVKPNPHVAIEWKTPNKQAYPSQQLSWNAQVTVDDPANLVSYEARKTDGWQSEVAEKPLKDAILSDQQKMVLLAANYHLDSSQDFFNDSRKSAWLVASPTVIVKNTSNRRWLFFDRLLNMEVSPLPSFLPITQSVGKIEFSASSVGFGQQTGDLAHWIWHLRGLGMNQTSLNNVAYQLISQIGHDPKIEWLTESRQGSQSITEQGLMSELTVSVPYRILDSGPFKLPGLQLRYFDPQSGKLQTRMIAAQSGLAVPPWSIWLLQWVGLLLLLFSMFAVLWLLKQLFINWRLRRAISEADDARQICTAIWQWQSQQAWSGSRSESNMKSWPVGVGSLAQFSDWYQQRFAADSELDQLVEQLNRWLYAKPEFRSEVNWQAVRQTARSWSRRLPLIPKMDLKGLLSRFKSA